MAPPAIVSVPALAPGLAFMVEGHITREHAPAIVVVQPVADGVG
jgi:hypothetical protein